MGLFRISVLWSLILAIAVTASAGASAGWLATQTLTADTVDAGRPSAALDPSGGAAIAWTQTGVAGVQLLLRPVAGSFADGSALTTSPTVPYYSTIDLVDGRIVAVWSDGTTVKAAVRAAGASSFTAMPDIGSGFELRLAAAPSGAAVVGFSTPDSATPARIAVLPAGGDAFGAPVDVDAPASGATGRIGDVAIRDDGAVLACYSETTGFVGVNLGGTEYCAFRPAAGGAFEAPLTVSPLADIGLPGPGCLVRESVQGIRALFAADGTGDVVWGHSCGPSATTQDVSDSHRAAAGTWSSAQHVESSVTVALRGEIDAAIDANGTPVVVYQLANAGSYTLKAAVLNGDGTASGLPDVYTGSEAVGAMQLRRMGDALLLAFSHVNTVAAAVRPSGSPSAPFGAPTELSATDQPISGLDSAGSTAGEGLVTWIRNDGTHNRLQSAFYDGAGPLINAVTIPSSGSAGQALSFAVDATDNLSSPTTTTWDFGDSASSTSAAPSHAYAAAGSYAVTMTATDARGLTTTRSGTVTVTGLPTDGTGGSGGTGGTGGTDGTGGTGGTGGTIDKIAPTITLLTISPASFRVAGGPTAIAAKAPRGATIRLRLSEAATAALTINRLTTGVRRGKTCKPGRARKGQRSCTLRTRVGTITRALVLGTSRIPFTGRIGSKPLAVGRYELSVVAADAAKNASTAKTAGFKIIR